MTARAIIRAFDPADLIGFEVQAAQQAEAPGDAADIAEQLLNICANPLSIECGDGAVHVVFAIVGEGYSVALVALFGADAGRWMTAIIRAVRAWLPQQGAHRIAMTAAADFAAANRFARMIGCEFEGRMRAFGPNREDHMLYAWVAPESEA